MKFRFVGEEASHFMGFQWFPGTEHDVADSHAIGKLSNSVMFEKVAGDEPSKAEEPKKPGRKPKQVSENGDDAHNG